MPVPYGGLASGSMRAGETNENTHEVAQQVAPESRIVYVDSDPIRRALRSPNAGTRGEITSRPRPEGSTGMWHHVERHELKRLSRLQDTEPGPRPQPARPPGTDLLPQIGHIVVLMMENHSYDNYLGMLPGRGDGFPLGPDGQPDVANPGPDGAPVRPRPEASTRQHQGVPSQSWHAAHVQWADGRCDGFAAAAQVAIEEAAACGQPYPGLAAEAPGGDRKSVV